MALPWKNSRRKNIGMETLLGVSLAAALSYFLWWRQRRTTEETPVNKEGTLPHTDYEAASAIARETGSEIFDD